MKHNVRSIDIVGRCKRQEKEKEEEGKSVHLDLETEKLCEKEMHRFASQFESVNYWKR